MNPIHPSTLNPQPTPSLTGEGRGGASDRIEQRRKLRAMCHGYVRRRICHMTDTEAYAMAETMSENTAETLAIAAPDRPRGRRRMTYLEVEAFRNVVFESVKYFNRRDYEHRNHMRYLKELAESREKREALEREQAAKKKDLVIHIIG